MNKFGVFRSLLRTLASVALEMAGAVAVVMAILAAVTIIKG